MMSAILASSRSRSDTLVAPSASIISSCWPREHSMPDLTGGEGQVREAEPPLADEISR